MTTSNPYAPPLAEISHSGDDSGALRELVLAWEKLRLRYNVILILPGLGVLWLWSAKMGVPIAVLLVLAVMVGIGANVCFFLAPLAELYLRALFRNGRAIGKRGRLLIFAAGLLVSTGVFMIACIPPIFAMMAHGGA